MLYLYAVGPVTKVACSILYSSQPFSLSHIHTHTLADMADSHRRRESAPALALKNELRRKTSKRPRTSTTPSLPGEGKSVQVPRTATCPNFVLKEEQEEFCITDVKITEMTVDRHCE